MEYLLLRIMINALSIMAAVKLVNGITFSGAWWKMIILGGVFGLVNSLIKPVIQLLSLPLIVLTLGFFTLVVNALMLMITAALSETFGLGFSIAGFWPAFWGAVTVSLVSMVLSCLTGAKRVHFSRIRGE